MRTLQAALTLAAALATLYAAGSFLGGLETDFNISALFAAGFWVLAVVALFHPAMEGRKWTR